MKKAGYSLISLLIYLGLSTYLFMIMLQYAVQTQNINKKMHSTANRIVFLETIIDMLTRDIRQAPANIESWKVCKESHFVYKGEAKDIGWQIEESLLVRSEGAYDDKKGTWRHRRKSAATPIINKMIVYYNKSKNQISSIQIDLTDKNETNYARTIVVSLINGEIA